MMRYSLSKPQLNLTVKLLVPFIVTRLLLLWLAWFSAYFVPSSSYPTPQVAEQGFIYTHFRFIDVWARWDSGWYLSIVKNGYQLSLDANGQNNLAFFPLYPLLIKTVVLIVPSFLRSDLLIIVIGLIISNLCLSGSIWLLYQLVLKMFQNKQLAEQSVWLLLLFPASFIFSCFYTESLFLLLSLGCCYFLMEKKYYLAGVVGFLAALTRSQGLLLLVLPILEMWKLIKEQNLTKSNLAKISWVALAIMTGLVSFLIYSQLAFDNWLLPLSAQGAWGKTLALPWQTIFSPIRFIGYITPLDKWIAIICIATSLYSFKVLKNKGLAIYGLISILLPLTTSILHSVTRYAVVIFPLYIVWAYLINKLKFNREIVLLVMMTIQTALFVAWCQFYWVM